MRKCIVTVTFLALMLSCPYSLSYKLDKSPATEISKFIQPHTAVEIFLKAVERGELVVFNQEITNSLLVPVRVEYIYELDSLIPKIEIYSKLKKPIEIPDNANFKVHGISAVIDLHGTIIEIKSHVRVE